jgi:hypothetical protein
MVLCARAVVQTVGGDDPRSLRRIAVRFASPASLDEDVAVRIYSLGKADRYALEATCGEDQPKRARRATAYFLAAGLAMAAGGGVWAD